jgi:YidC/Oxa1 family membrane protein insertase
MLLLFGVSMLLPMIGNKNVERNTLLMTGAMSIFMLWFGWGAPAGVLLYWDTQSLIGVTHTIISRKILERKDEAAEQEVIEIKPVKVEVTRKERKNRPRRNK